MDVMLTGTQLRRLAGPGTRVILYRDLNDIGSIEELFNGYKKVLILYVQNESGASASGHWTLLLYRRSGARHIIEYMDSYGGFINKPLSWNSAIKNNNLEQDDKRLFQLLSEFESKPNHEVHYNELPLQARKQGVNTCGRWVGLRARFSDISLEEFQELFRKAKRSGTNLDELVVAITDQLNGTPIV
jgi:hypothetical protein